MYGQNAIAVNEFLGKSWSHVCNYLSLIGFCYMNIQDDSTDEALCGIFMLQVPPGSTESLGVMVLKSHGIFPEARWYWIGVAALIGYVFLFNIIIIFALQYLDRKYHMLLVFQLWMY